FGESDVSANQRVLAALSAGLTPVLCVGETLEHRESGETMAVVKRQVERGLKGVSEDALAGMLVAYEPVWAIGTGKVATPEQAQEVHAMIREQVGARSEKAGSDMRLLYGGSVKPGNAAELFAQTDIDGGLIGGASLKAADFAAIVSAC
ncbi:MAG: triose-phosphate isomerase, partial [Myxococcota bacterium]